MEISSYIEFLKAAAKNPLQLSTVFQTSPWLAERLISSVDFKTAKHIIELGAGAGAITEPISKRLEANCVYTGFEVVPSLAKYLKDKYPKLDFIVDSAQKANEVAKQKGAADAVVSSLPWTIFSHDLQLSILDSVEKSLKPGGKFMTYICMNAQLFPTARSFKAVMRHKFAKVEKLPIVWKNIPPATVYVCTKQ